jgi:glycosyltransferase involved in cell wall biosynthesis
MKSRTMSSPLITAIIDTFNQERFIEQALNSVLDQGLCASDLEVLVVDDGSTDRTTEIVATFANRVEVLRKENGGQASAFNFAISRAKGEIIAFLDGDDWWAKGKLKTVLNTFDSNPNVGVVGHGFYEVDELTARSVIIFPESDHRVTLNSIEDGINFRNIMCFLGTSRVAIRRKILNLVGAIPPSLVVEADEFMSTMAVARSEAVLIQQPLTFYRLHPGNLYQFRGQDVVKVQRKMKVLTALSGALRQELPQAGVPGRVVNAIVEPIDYEANRLKLQCLGGMPWRTFQVERTGMRLAYKHMGWKYRLFKACVLSLTLALPPKLFYKLRAYYSTMNLRRLRKFTGEPISYGTVKSHDEYDRAKKKG